MTCDKHDKWRADVRYLLRTGLGVEDIAIKIRCPVRFVRAEVQILREEGKLAKMLARPMYGPTALRMMI